MAATKKTKTTISLAPLSVDEALAALLQTPPPVPEKKPKPRMKKGKKR